MKILKILETSPYMFLDMLWFKGQFYTGFQSFKNGI